MTARVAIALCSSDDSTASAKREQQLAAIKDLQKSLKFFIFIGGVSPQPALPEDFAPLLAPSLHVMGTADPLLQHSKLLTSFFSPETSCVLTHPEGHQIPSMRTGG